MHRKFTGVVAALAVVLGSAAVALPQAGAVGTSQDVVVDDFPPAITPHVLDGDVMAIAEVGDVVVLGGRFTQARSAATGSPTVARSNILSYDKNTGELLSTFAPVLDNTVRAVVPASDGSSVFVGGQFGRLNGTPAYKLVKLDARTGQRVPGFNPPIISAAIMDVRLAGNRLFIGGHFTDIGGQPRQYLAELDPTTGALRPGTNSTFSGVAWAGTVHVYKIDVSPDGSTMVAIGNFRTVDGQPRVQVAKLDLTVTPAQVTGWRTTRWEIRCGSSGGTQFDVRDVEFSPDGSYFVIGATGGHPPVGALCDGVTRWETAPNTAGQEPTWYAPTGGDSVYSVGTSGAAVYTGGHFRWLNNPVYVQSFKGPGAVDREGIAALDPANGIPLSWNPGRDRGQAVWDLLVTDDGLYVGSDTDRIARYLYRARIAYFPTAGGTVVPQPSAPQLPVRVHFAGSSADPNGVVERRYDGSAASASTPVPGAGTGWSTARAVFAAGNKLYTAKSNGTLTVRSYQPGTFGAEHLVNLNGLTAFASEAAAMTGGFYDDGHIYFTTSGNNSLYRRGLSAESDIVGAARTTVVGGITGIDWRNVRGMFLAGEDLYWVRSSNGELHRMDWVAGAPVAGTDTIVTGPGISGVDWRASALFATQAPVAPVAVIDSTCVDTRCEFDGSQSSVFGGTITAYEWDFGDGTTATSASPVHIYVQGGTYDVTLEVTSDGGLTGTTTRQVTVSDPPAAAVSFVAAAANTAQTTTTSRSVTVPPSVVAGDTLLLFLSTNSGTATATDPAGWTRIGSATTSGATTVAWSRTATATDAGSSVAAVTSALVRADLVVAAYRGGSVQPASAVVAAESSTTATHTTPTVQATVPGSWLVSYWADKSASTSSWAGPGGHTSRHTYAGTGAGHVSELLVDSGGAIQVGTAGGLSATANSAVANAAMASIVVAPTG